MSAWLFMFAASRTSDYQFVMQPEVFDTESCDVLRSQLQLDDSDPARLRTVTVPTKQAGDVLCAYRSGPVDVNTADRVDSAGRKLLFAYGAVIDRPTPEVLERIPQALNAARPAFERELASFLNCNTTWSPRIEKAREITSSQAKGDGLRGLSSSVSILTLALVLSLGITSILYFKNRSLEDRNRALEEDKRALQEDNGFLDGKSRSLDDKNRSLEDEVSRLRGELGIRRSEKLAPADRSSK
ncbi:MAG: hypothetical protein ACRC1G_04220 [Bradyrhizobium sp.]|nr:hypothetical protein [Bradyrhizobium sp.]